jgi:hypothetical protein
MPQIVKVDTENTTLWFKNKKVGQFAKTTIEWDDGQVDTLTNDPEKMEKASVKSLQGITTDTTQ